LFDTVTVDVGRTARGALAGAVAAGVWAAQSPLDQRVFGVPYLDQELLGKAVTRGRAWHPVGAALHVLSIGMPNPSMSDELRNLNMAIAEGTKRSGGRRDQVLAVSGIPEALLRVAEELNNQYVVTYGRPDRLIPPEKLQVTVSRPGVTVRARTRVAGK